MNEDLELMSHMLKDVIERIDKLAIVSERHEKQWARSAAAARAALQAFFNENGDGQENQ